MKYKELPQSEALTPGSSLWVLSGFEQSSWSKKINWYLNFLIFQAKQHKKIELPNETRNILTTTKTDYYHFEINEKAPLLIASENLLPNKNTLVISHSDSSNNWIQKCFNLWINSNSPSLRVFLPKNITSNDFKKQWTLLSSDLSHSTTDKQPISISLVVEK